MGLDRKSGESISRVEREVYERTGVSSTRPKKKMRIEVNVSDYAMRGILSIECENR